MIIAAGLFIVASGYAGGVNEGVFTVNAGFTVVFDADLEGLKLEPKTMTITGYGTAPLNGSREQALTTAKARARTQLALQAAGTRFSYQTADDEVLFTARSSSQVTGARTVETKEMTGPDGEKLLFAVTEARLELRLPPQHKVFTTALRGSGDALDPLLRTLMKEAVQNAARKYGYTQEAVSGSVFITNLDVN